MSTTYDWLKQISPAVLKWDEIPLYGAGPAFPWQELSEQLTKIFQFPVTLTRKETDWRNANELTKGLSGDPILLQIGIANLEGTICWVMSKTDLGIIMEKLLGRQAEDFNGLDKDCFTGFYHYLSAQVLNAISQIPFGRNLNPGLMDKASLPTEASLCQEIEIAMGTEQFARGRLIISPEALTSWRQRFADRSLTTTMQSPLAAKVQVPIHLEIGRTKLSKKEWKNISPGDLLLLDHCSYDPAAAKGRVMLTINGVPMFRAKLKQGNIKILEFPTYHEAAMNNDNPAHDDLGDDDLGEEELGEPEESLGDEAFGETEEPAEDEAAEGAEVKEAEEHQPQAIAEDAKGKKINPTDIPLNIVVEVGRLQMSMQKLMEIEPGNTLELDVHPENGVDLVVNGRRIGKGELLRIGESLGVRILDIG